MNQRQLQVIDYLREENRVLREPPGGRRVRLDDNQRSRLATKAKGLGRKILAEVATIVTPETLLAWHRKWSLRTAIQNFVAHYHSERNHQGLANQLIRPEPGRPGNAGEVQRRGCLGGMLNDYYRATGGRR